MCCDAGKSRKGDPCHIAQTPTSLTREGTRLGLLEGLWARGDPAAGSAAPPGAKRASEMASERQAEKDHAPATYSK